MLTEAKHRISDVSSQNVSNRRDDKKQLKKKERKKGLSF